MGAIVLVVVGTRPEVIKLAPVIRALKQRPEVSTVVCETGQSTDLLPQALQDRDLEADCGFLSMYDGQSLANLTGRILSGLDGVLRKVEPSVLVVQGDTTTAFCGALAGFYRGVAVAHVEAGLRTSTLREPFPEELNRRLISRMAVLHFAPTAHAMANLQEESVVGGHLTGNPVVDELQAMLAAPLWPGDDLAPGEGVVVVTCHRRESWDSRLPLLVLALAELADANPKWRIVWPLHPNPLIERVARPTLDRLLHPNVTLLSALPYRQFIRLLQHAELVITDSGGVIEEAATMGRRLLIIRDETERPEAIASGRARLVPRGSTAELPALAAEMIATVPDLPWSTLFGDGKAGPRIADLLVEWVEAHERG